MITMLNATTRSLTSICGCGFMLLTLTSCSAAEDDRYSDSRRCSQYREYGTCMSMQQYHRDREQLMNQEKALINAEQARENLRMLREIRRRRGEQ